MTEASSGRGQVGAFLLGMLLLILGVLLLMGRAGVVHLNFTRIGSLLVLIIGGFEAITAFASSSRGRIFWGSVLFLSGLLVLLISYSFIPGSWSRIWPSVMIIPGLAFLMLFFSNPKEISLLVITVLFVAVGWGGLLSERGDFHFSSGIMETLRFVTPIAVVVAGFYVIWKNFFPKSSGPKRPSTEFGNQDDERESNKPLE